MHSFGAYLRAILSIHLISVITFVLSLTTAGSGVNSGGGALQASLRNPLGFGEITKISVGSNTSEGQECSLITSIPWYTRYRSTTSSSSLTSNLTEKNGLKDTKEIYKIDRGNLQLSMKKTEENSSHFTSFKSLLHTMGCNYTNQEGSHSVSSELTLRDEIPTSHQSAPKPLLQSLHSRILHKEAIPMKVKTTSISHAKSASKETLSNINSSSKASIQYTFMKDYRNRLNPILGSYVKSSVEVAIPSGVQSAQYVRTDINFQNNVKIMSLRGADSGMIASFSGSLGTLSYHAFSSLTFHLVHQHCFLPFATYVSCSGSFLR